jgi:5-methyltetrahydrofolate--homocysteine methyltransferase
MGPTNRSLTLDAEDVCLSFEQMANAYYEQAHGLIRGGVDVLLIETIFDVMNAKAAVAGARRAMESLSVKGSVDLWLSLTLADAEGRMLTGLALKDFISAMAYAHPAVMTLNCGFGPKALLPHVARLGALCHCAFGVYPNAGLPDASGAYTLSPRNFVEELRPLLEKGDVSIVGGCCGTTDAHIRALHAERLTINGERLTVKGERLTVKGEGLTVKGEGAECIAVAQKSASMLLIGERCNVAGSRMFKTMIEEKRYADAVALAVKQMENGAWGIDVNVDAPMLDAPSEMRLVLNAFMGEARLTGVPIMIDSSSWEVMAQALSRVSGKAIVNSLTLKDGEEAFLRKARVVADYGAGLVVMAADEQGQATTYERRMEICERAYTLLREQLDFPAEDIIFDPNVLAICTGVPEHMAYAKDLLRTINELRQRFPESHIIGGLSNLSFAFRGCEPMRRALHSVFLHHARQRGLDMVILSPAALTDYEAIPQDLRTLLEDAVVNGTDVTQELMERSQQMRVQTHAPVVKREEQREVAPEERLQNAVLRGGSATLESDVATLLETTPPLDIIAIYLMKAMERVGDLFGRGEMFLPQVIRAAEVMSKVVTLLQPHLEQSASHVSEPMRHTAVLATVKGDVHDIGKNICATLLRCNGFEVIDLGVMVEADVIVKTVEEVKPDFVGLSGLITPSLGEMQCVVEALHRLEIPTPILIGGATTSAEHTASHLAPHTDLPVLWTSDASQLVLLAKKLYVENEGRKILSPYVSQLQSEQETLRASLTPSGSLSPLQEVRDKKVELY